jgi:hypothetical protein
MSAKVLTEIQDENYPVSRKNPGLAGLGQQLEKVFNVEAVVRVDIAGRSSIC